MLILPGRKRLHDKSHQLFGIIIVIYIMCMGLYGGLVEFTEGGEQDLWWYCIVNEWHMPQS